MSGDQLDPTAGTSTMVARAEADPHRPRYHFVSPAGWLNDPNGVGEWDGVFHLFYQYNPHAPVHARIHWGHATSTDLVHWSDRPVALVPDDVGPDSEGCWSGVLVNDGGRPVLVYSGHNDGRQLPCLAYGSADLLTWTKEPSNPVLASSPPGLDVPAFRDHAVWREGEEWFQLIGSGIRGEGGAALLYSSPDLLTWTYLGPLLTGDATSGEPVWSGTTWECVDLFRVPGETAEDDGGAGRFDVLVFSAWDDEATLYPLYWTGRRDGTSFAPDGLHRLDLGGRHFYAPQSFADSSDRRVIYGWSQDGRDQAAALAAGWSGVMSLPRELKAGGDGRLVSAPVAEVAQLRREHTSLTPFSLASGERRRLPFSSDQADLELDLRLDPGGVARVSLRVSGDPADADSRAADGERTVVELRRPPGPGPVALRLDRARSSVDPKVDSTPHEGLIDLTDDGVVHLRVLLDHSAIELFANGVALSTRVYPTLPDSLGIEIESAWLESGPQVEVLRADLWQMADIWDAPRELWPQAE